MLEVSLWVLPGRWVVACRVIQHQQPVQMFAGLRWNERTLTCAGQAANGLGPARARVEPPGLHLAAG
jgi:hypothetical protein